MTFTRALRLAARRVLAFPADAARRTLAHPRGRDTRAVGVHLVDRRARREVGLPPRASRPTAISAAFADPPLVPVPEEQHVVFVGALEAYKNVDGLAAAWRQVAAALPARS